VYAIAVHEDYEDAQGLVEWNDDSAEREGGAVEICNRSSGGSAARGVKSNTVRAELRRLALGAELYILLGRGRGEEGGGIAGA